MSQINASDAQPNRKLSGIKPSEELGDRPRFAWLPIDELVVDERYQRRITKDGNTLINRIVREFCWAKMQPLTVTGPDASGDYPVIDGQHRLEACRRHPKVTQAPCWIVPAPRIADQATTFVAVNKARIGVTRVNVFWASLAAGDEAAKWLKSVCDQAGVAIGRVGTGIQPPKTTVALASLLRLRATGDAAIVRALALLVAAQPEAENAFRAATITSLTRLLALHEGRIDERRLANAVADMVLDDEIEKARVYRKTFGGNTEAALQVIFARAYNKGLREENRIPET